MSMRKNWEAGLIDCEVLLREIDFMMDTNEPDLARQGVDELGAIVSRWMGRLICLRKSLIGGGYTATVSVIEAYIDDYRAMGELGRERLSSLNWSAKFNPDNEGV